MMSSTALLNNNKASRRTKIIDFQIDWLLAISMLGKYKKMHEVVAILSLIYCKLDLFIQSMLMLRFVYYI